MLLDLRVGVDIPLAMFAWAPRPGIESLIIGRRAFLGTRKQFGRVSELQSDGRGVLCGIAITLAPNASVLCQDVGA